MTAGAEVVCNDIVRKVEIEEKCVGNAGLDTFDLNGVGDVGTVDGNVGGNSNGDAKDDTDESSYVFVNGGLEVSGGDPDDTGGVTVDEFDPKSDSADEVDESKEDFGVENGDIPVDSLSLETKGIDHGSITVSDFDPKSDSADEVDQLKEVFGVENGRIPVDSMSLETKGIDHGSITVSDFDPKSDSADEVDQLKEKFGEENRRIPVDSLSLETKGIDHGSIPVSDFDPKSDSADEVDQLKEEFGVENGRIPVDSLPLETKGIDFGSITVSDSEVKAVKDDVIMENGSTVDPHVVLEVNAIGQDVNGHLDKISGEEEAVVKSTEEGDDANKIPNVETEMDDIGSRVTFDSESTLNTIDSSFTVTESDSTPDVIYTTVSNTDCDVMVNDGPESISNIIDKAESQVTVDGCDTPTEDLECQVTADGSESSGSPPEGQVSFDECGKPSEDLTSQVTGDETAYFGSPINERECTLSVDGSDSIDCLADNQESAVSVESESSGSHTEEVDGKSKEHQDLLVITSEIKVEAEPNYVSDAIKVEHQSVLVPVPSQSENNKAEGIDIGISTESEENSDSGLLLFEDTDDGILEMKETQISGTEAMLLVHNADTENSEEKLETHMEGSSETLLKVTESLEIEANSEEMEEQVKREDEVRESQILVTDIVQDDFNLAYNITESANEAEVPLETETNIEPVIDVNTALQYEVSNSVDKPQEGFSLVRSSENAEIVDLVISECNNSELLVVKDNDSHSTSDELMVIQQKAEIVAHLDTENRAAEDIACGTGIKNVNIFDDDEKETEVKDAPVEYIPHLITEYRAVVGMDCGTRVEIVDVSDDEERESEVKDAPVESVPHLVIENASAPSAEGIDCKTVVENVDFPDDKVTEVKDAPVGGHSTLSFSDTIVNGGGVIEFGSFGHHETTHNLHNEEAEDINGIQSDEIPTSSVEGSVIDSIDVQNEVAEVLAYNFLIKIPRCEDENLRDQIRSAQLQVDEKTRLRDAIRAEIHGKRAKLKALNEAFNAAKVEETAARRLVRLKRQEIDSVQVVINRWKNAMSVEDIDGRIYNMEHMIQHETLLLKDEKQFIREIKQLKTLRDQLASNMGSSEEIRQAIDQKDDNEERMKTLRKELDSLKDKASKAETVVKTVGKTYDEESRRERELQAQFKAADDVRQKAYAYLNSLKKLFYDKNKNFRQFKEALVDARKFATHGNKDKLHQLCANQVETFMEQWNNNDEFRKEYVNRCNINASRRQRAWDGAPPVPDDVAVRPGNVNDMVDDVTHVQPGNANDKVDVTAARLGSVNDKIISSTENKHTDGNSRSIENIWGQKNQTLKAKGVAKPPALGSDDIAVVAELAVVDKKEEDNTLTKEEIELAKKAEELRKEETAAKLKEQRRLEEKAKAIEALERKKRNAEKAQIRAELRARKEAEQKEKEREKRLRKKEKKKTGGGEVSMNGEDAPASSENANEAATKDIEPLPKEKNKKKTQPPLHFFSKQQLLKPKPIPPPLVNRNKKRWQQWGKVALAVAGIFVLFLLGNTRYFRLKFNGVI